MELMTLQEVIAAKSVQLGNGESYNDVTITLGRGCTITVNREGDPKNFPILIRLHRSSALELAAQICKVLTIFQEEPEAA